MTKVQGFTFDYLGEGGIYQIVIIVLVNIGKISQPAAAIYLKSPGIENNHLISCEIKIKHFG